MTCADNEQCSKPKSKEKKSKQNQSKQGPINNQR